MIYFWDSIIRPLLEKTNPSKILKIGYGADINRNLMEFCLNNGSLLDIYSKYPPSVNLAGYRNAFGNVFEIYKKTPLDDLLLENTYDIIFIDVKEESDNLLDVLNLIFSSYSNSQFPIIVFYGTSQNYVSDFSGKCFEFEKIDKNTPEYVLEYTNFDSFFSEAISKIFKVHPDFCLYNALVFDGIGVFFFDKNSLSSRFMEVIGNKEFFEFLDETNDLKDIEFSIDFENSAESDEELSVYEITSDINDYLVNHSSNALNDSPLVSVIVPYVGGLNELMHLFEDFDRNADYSNYEIIINTAHFSKRSLEYLSSLDLPIVAVGEIEDKSFSAINNGLVSYSNGSYLCFLNGVKPLFGWLGSLVESYLENDDAGLVQSNLISLNSLRNDNHIILNQVNFDMDDEYQLNEYYTQIPLDNLNEYCDNVLPFINYPFIVAKDKFMEAGGFSEDYICRNENLDLSLKLIRNNCINYKSFKSLCIKLKDEDDELESVALKDYKRFTTNWKLYLKRRKLMDKINSSKVFSDKNFKILFVVPYKYKNVFFKSSFIKFLEKNGWEYYVIAKKDDFYDNVDYLINDDIDMVVSFVDNYNLLRVSNENPKLIRILWITDDEFEISVRSISTADIVFASNELIQNNVLEKFGFKSILLNHNNLFYNENANDLSLNDFDRFKDSVIDYISRIKIFIKIAAPNWDEIKSWGDYHFALSLKKELEKRGCIVIIQTLYDWDNYKDLFDAVIVLRGLKQYYPRLNNLNLMWNISHPEMVDDDEYESFDYIFVASDYWASQLQDKLDVGVEPLLQCTDTDFFFKEQVDEFRHDLLFVGNSRGVYRKILKDLDLENFNNEDIDLAVYGRAWEKFIPSQFIIQDYISNREVHKAYSSAKILLNDHWEDMSELGFISNRLFDGFASEAFIISDTVEGMEGVFGDVAVTYSTPEELHELIDFYLENERERLNVIAQGREIVLKHHTFAKRAEFLIDFINKFI